MSEVADDEPAPFDPDAPFKLSKPLMTHKGEVTELVLDMPKARSFIKHGVPYKVGRDGEVNLEIKALMGFASDMTGIEPVLLESLQASDVMPLGWMIVRKLRYDPPNG